MSRESVVLEVNAPKERLELKPSNTMVVTITKKGEPLSLFGDDIWDYSATATSKKKINFRNKVECINPAERFKDTSDHNLIESVEFLKVFTLQWVSVVGGCSMSKLNGDVSAVSFLVRYCFGHCIQGERIFSTPEAIDFLISRASTAKQTGLLLGKIQRFIDTATVLSDNSFWGGLKPSIEFQSRLRRARKQFPETTDTVQTLIIPSSIYQSILKKIIEDLECFLEFEETIKFVFTMRSRVRDEAVNIEDKSLPAAMIAKQSGRLAYLWKKLLHENKEVPKALERLYIVGISKSKDWAGLVDTLSRWQLRCAILISAFTGMRKSELLAIPFNGLKKLTTDRGDIPVVWSTTTKLEPNGSPRFTKWVTTSVVEVAFKVARIITRGALAWSDNKQITDVKELEIPLFFSVEYGKKGIPHPLFRFTTTAFNTTRMMEETYKDELLITQKDLEETSWFMYGESLPTNIKVGVAWPLSFHQFRRSMTVYAAASGLVSYPALKAQLKHISMVMTVYYADSNSRAINILGNEAEVKALRAEWIEAKARAESDDLNNLLESAQPLAGAAGKKLRVQQVKGELPKFLENRKSTKQAVKKGKFRYRSTLVGSCVSVAPCNKGAGVLASACISCENAVFLSGSKAALEQTKEFYEAELEKGVPKRARQEYEANIKKVNSFLNVLVEVVEVI